MCQTGPAEPTRLKITLTRFLPPEVGTKSQISGADFRVTNVGRQPFRDDFGFVSDAGVFSRDGGTWGVAFRERGTCSAPFYAPIFRLAPGQRVQGCVWFKPTQETAGYGPPAVVSIFLDRPLDWSVGQGR